MRKGDIEALRRLSKLSYEIGPMQARACRAALVEMEQLRWERDVLAWNLGVKDSPILVVSEGDTVVAVIIREPQNATDPPLNLPKRVKYG